jgi:hypothetical protein
MDTATKAELAKFLDMATSKGHVNTNTGGGYKAAIAKILAEVPDTQDIRTIDVKTEIRRYNNLHPGDLSPSSLAQYEKRINLVIAAFLKHKEDPTAPLAFASRPVSTNGGKADGEKKSKPQAKKKAPAAAPAPTDHTVTPQTGSMSASGHAPTAGTATEMNLALPFPLRPGYLAQVVIPRDMTTEEAERLCVFIRSLAQATK